MTVPAGSSAAQSVSGLSGGRSGTLRASWLKVLAMVLLPALFALATNLAVIGGFAASGTPEPTVDAGEWINAWTLLVYALMLLCVYLLARSEGLRLSDLANLDRGNLGRDLRRGLVLAPLVLAALAVASFVASAVVFGLLGNPFAGQAPGSSPGFGYADSLPLVLASVVMIPLAAGIVEELSFRGYALPRLAGLSGRVWAVVITSAGFGLEHVGFALFWEDWRFALMRGLSTFLVGLLLGTIYLKQGRLVPLIVAHALVNVVGLGLPALLF